MGLLDIILGKKKELEEKKFPKEGDFVKVTITSQYLQAAHGVGEVVETKRHPGWTCVRFEDNHVAYFPTTDLIIAREEDYVQKEEIVEEANNVEPIPTDKPVEEIKKDSPKKLTVEQLEKLNKKAAPKEPEPNLEELITSPFRIPIRKKALEKAYAYIALIPKVLGRHEECYGHLLALENDKTGAIVEDVTLAPNQSVNAVRCEIGFDAVAEAGADTKYSREVLEYINEYGRSGNKEDVLEVMRKVNNASDYVALDDLLKTLDSNRRTEIIDLLHKACRISAQNLKDMIKIADSKADSDALQFAKEVNRRKNPALKLTAYIALEHIVNAIGKKGTGRFSAYGASVDSLKEKDTPLYKIVDTVDNYIERIDRTLKECRGTYPMFHKPKYGCNECLERKGCNVRKQAKELKGLLRAAKSIAEDGKNTEGEGYARDC